MITGILPNHIDPELEPGEYLVTVTTKGGAAIVNGERQDVYKALADLWEAVTINHQALGADLSGEIFKWVEQYKDLDLQLHHDFVAGEIENQMKVDMGY